MKKLEGEPISPSSILSDDIKSWKTEKAQILSMVISLDLRGAIPAEIRQIIPELISTDKPIGKKKRLKLTTEEQFRIYFTEEYRNERAKKLIKELSKPLSDDRRTSITFARKALDMKLIGNTFYSWRNLHKLYQRYQRPLPEDFSDKIICEVYVDAISSARIRGDRVAIEKYKKIRDSIVRPDSLFAKKLAEEEKFIDENIHHAMGISGPKRDKLDESNKNKKGSKIDEEKIIEENAGNKDAEEEAREKIREVFLEMQNIQTGKRAK